MRFITTLCFFLTSGLFLLAPSIEAEQTGRIQPLPGRSAVSNGLTAADWQSIRAVHKAQRRTAAPATLDSLFQQAYLKASNTEPEELFAQAVAISGDTIVVAATEEDSGATGVDGDQTDNSASFSGAAYVFVRRNGVWTQQAYLKASNTNIDDVFGFSVAISGDTIVVGAPGEDSSVTGVNGEQDDNSAEVAGAAYVFVRTNGLWTQQAYLKASNTDAGDSFGGSVAISGDTIVVSAIGEESNATGVDGDQTDNSLSLAGAAYVFGRANGLWTQQAYLKAFNTDRGDVFGYSTAITAGAIAIGAVGEASSATGIDGDQADNSAVSAGAAYLFVRINGVWTPDVYLKASNTDAGDGFGSSLAISDTRVVVGAISEDSNAVGVNGNQSDNSANGAGAAYVFKRRDFINFHTWSQEAYLKASNTDAGDGFGVSAISGDTIVITAYLEESIATGINGNQLDNSAKAAGAAYVFTFADNLWTQQAYLKASNTDVGDDFGLSVGISGDTIVVGSPNEASSATGVNGDDSDNNAVDAGAAYVFGPTPATTLGNISTRMQVETGDNVLIGGVIITGTQSKKVLLRAIGPSLPLSGSLADPFLELHDQAGAMIASNDNWKDAPNKQEIIDSRIPPTNDLESAVLMDLDPGSYTAIVRGVNNTTGIGLVEGYDLDQGVDSELANISTRGRVQSGDDVMIGGFIILGSDPQKVIVRAIGPSLPMTGKLADPVLELHNPDGTILASNDNWRSTQESEIMDTGIPPANDLESAIVATLPPEAYTAVVRGKNNGTGIGLVEAYRLEN